MGNMIDFNAQVRIKPLKTALKMEKNF